MSLYRWVRAARAACPSVPSMAFGNLWEGNMKTERFISRTTMIIASAVAGGVLLQGARSFGQTSEFGVPRNAVVAFAGKCPPGWEPFRSAEGKVIVGTGQDIPASGGNQRLIVDHGVKLIEANIPELSVKATTTVRSSIDIPFMPASSSNVGGFLFHNNPDVYFYGRATYASSGADRKTIDTPVTLDTTIGSASPTAIDTAMAFVSLNYCRKK